MDSYNRLFDFDGADRLTGRKLAEATGCLETYGGYYAPWMNIYLPKYHIDTRLRVCAFLAQTAHESGMFRYSRELATGERYEGRKDLGNTQKGDGIRYKGRGLIQITGRANYEAFTAFSGVDVVKDPELVEGAEMAVWSAVWFWTKNNLNGLADGGEAAFERLTRRINGGTNGLEHRLTIYRRCLVYFK